MLDTINLDFIKTEIGNDPAVICEMLILFQEVLTEFEDSLVLAIGERSYPVAFITTHKIKPSLKMFELQELISKTTILETLIKQKVDFSIIQKEFAEIQTLLPDTHANIEQLLLQYQ
ncbi:MAG: hypothetical protein MK066_04640 [Crocinitomicaceae bacterium]|nr:hypothetical protein [Crocinitomicaceae bacterium]